VTVVRARIAMPKIPRYALSTISLCGFRHRY
jgi:hypothetical protein